VSGPNAYTRPRPWADDGRTLLASGAAGDDHGLFVIDVPAVEP
jgi:hypothetical protein